MATDYATMASQPAHYQQHAYKTSAHYSPLGSGANTPTNISPTSPRTTHAALHINRVVPTIEPRKPPIYVPAALRRTEKPSKQSPPRNDSAVSTHNNSWNECATSPTVDGTVSPLSRIMTEDINSLYNDAPLSPVTGPITRNHWQSDSSAPVCSASACQTPFGFFSRRHHCRKCGGVFCWQHSQRLVKLDEHATFHPDGVEHRACDRCHSQFRDWEQMRTSRHNSDSSAEIAAPAMDTPIAPQRPENQRYGSLATSLQNVYNWSTF